MSTNPGLLPDGTPNRAYLEKLSRNNNPHLPAAAHTTTRNIGYARPPQQQPQQQQQYPPYYTQQHAQQQQQQPQPQPQPQAPYPYATSPYPPTPPGVPNSQYPHSRYGPPSSGSVSSTSVGLQPPPPPPPPPPAPHQNGAAYPPYHHDRYAYQQQPPHHQAPHPHAHNPHHNPHHAQPPMSSSFRPSGRRKALLVGINYKGTSAELRGCVRDVTFVHHLLGTKFGFRNSDFVILTDEATGISGVRRGAPTRRTILESLRWLVSDTRPGDSLWFSFSGHGSQVRDTSGDESDGYDETILPIDYKKSGHIVDDELYDIVRRVCRGARLTVLLDACHSGTGLDLPYQHDVFGTGTGLRISGPGRQQSIAQGLMGVAGALLNGNASGALSAGLRLAGKKKKEHPGPDNNAGEVLLFSGCKDNQTSADTSKLSGGLTTGAMTYALIETLEHSTVGDWRNYSYRKLLQTMRQKLRANRMTQTPQFSTSHPFDLGSLFVL